MCKFCLSLLSTLRTNSLFKVSLTHWLNELQLWIKYTQLGSHRLPVVSFLHTFKWEVFLDSFTCKCSVLFVLIISICNHLIYTLQTKFCGYLGITLSVRLSARLIHISRKQNSLMYEPIDTDETLHRCSIQPADVHERG